jgi:hypothetical protein
MDANTQNVKHDTILENGFAAPRSYEDIQDLSAQTGRPTCKLIALAVNNDPFYAGVPSRRAWAEWFAALWDRFQFTPGYHLRFIHYRLVVDPSPPLMPVDRSNTSGQPYRNTEACWNKLQLGGRDARHLGLVAPDAFSDHRNPAPLIHASETQSPDEPDCQVGELPAWSAPAVFLSEGDLGRSDMPEMPSVTVGGYDYESGDQPYHLELWIEKSTMNKVLNPICRELGVNLVPMVGFQTVTGTVQLLQRLDRLPADKPTRIGYVSDFDPAGHRMPPAVARVVEFYLDEFAPDKDVKLTPIALTHEQVQQYKLPRVPIKEDDKRRRGFQEKYGEGAVELDALEALHPGELVQMIRNFFAPYRDVTLEERITEAREEAQQTAQEEWDEATANHRRGLEVTRAKIRRIVDAVRPEAQRLNTRLQTALAPLLDKVERNRHAITSVSVTPDLPERPSPEEEGRDESAWLYASDRGYLEQLKFYPEQSLRKKPSVKKAKSTVKCGQCGKPFEQKRSDARFCSQKCRVAFSRAKAKTETTAAVPEGDSDQGGLS